MFKNKMTVKNLILIIILTLSTMMHGTAQFDLIGQLSSDHTILNSLNPAQTMDSTIVIGLPGIFNSNRYKGIAYGDIISSSNNINTIDATTALSVVEPSNHYQNYLDLQGLALHVTTKSITISAGYNVKLMAYAEYTDELVKLGLEGNAQYLDEQLSIGPNFGLRSYHEVYLGLAKKIGNISVGGRFKVLSGIEDLSTSQSQINITTDSEYYALQFDNQYQLNSSGVLAYTDLSDFEVDFDAIRYSGLSSNVGYGVDLGIGIDVNDRWNIKASALDIGKIKWTKRVQNYTSSDSYSYEGVDLVKLIKDSDNFELQDSLYNILQIETTENEYETALAGRYNVSTTYEIDPSQIVGISTYMINHDGPNQWAIALQYRKQLGRLHLSGQYAYINDNPTNIGAGLGINLGWLQLNAYSDNILGLMDMQNTRSTNFRLGASVHL